MYEIDKKRAISKIFKTNVSLIDNHGELIVGNTL
jgi:hypothetical protein